MTHPRPLTLPDALRRAATLGISAQLLVGLELQPTELLIALRTTDEESSLHLIFRPPFGRNEIPLDRRSQSGPECWDYPVTLPTWCERYALRLERAEVTRDLPLLSGVQAILETHGWTADMTQLGEPLVSASDFERALSELSAEHLSV